MDSVQEVIFVGLPGPTHNYGGLSADNVASSTNRGRVSNPAEAAMQALSLARLLRSLGLEAAILPPQLRPHLGLLRTQFIGSDESIIAQAAKVNPALFEKACSSSAMWTANAATVGAGADTADGKLHLTPANLQTNIHRRIEAEDTHRVLAAIFKDVPDAVVHAPLPAHQRDEGAANHMRLTTGHGQTGLNVYIYGTDGSEDDAETARQTLSASQTVARAHGVRRALFIKQHPDLIRQGVFHNDVIGVANETVLLAHEQSYAKGASALGEIEAAYRDLTGEAPHFSIVRTEDLSVEEAVRTYLFNSQIVTTKGGMVVIAPTEVKDLYGGKAALLMERIRADRDNPIEDVRYIDLRQSMHNGGGPACLRLRVPMSTSQIAALRTSVNVMADEALLSALSAVIETHYPYELRGADLADPALYYRCRAALAEMGKIMKLPLLPSL